MPILCDPRKPNEGRIPIDILEFSEMEIEEGETISIEEVMAEFGVDATQDQDKSRLASIPFKF
jgi:hypothetical protein